MKLFEKKNKDKSVGFWRHKMIPKKRLLNQFNSWNKCNDGTPNIFYCGEFPLKYIVSKSYTECANNIKFETQYMKEEVRNGQEITTDFKILVL